MMIITRTLYWLQLMQWNPVSPEHESAGEEASLNGWDELTAICGFLAKEFRSRSSPRATFRMCFSLLNCALCRSSAATESAMHRDRRMIFMLVARLFHCHPR